MIQTIEGHVMNLILETDLVANNIQNMNSDLEKYMNDLNEMDEVDEVNMNFSNVENIDSVGISFIIGLYKNVIKDGRGFRVTECSDDIKQLFKLMKLEDYFEIEE